MYLLFSHFFISVWAHGYLYYILDNNILNFIIILMIKPEVNLLKPLITFLLINKRVLGLKVINMLRLLILLPYWLS